MATTKSEIKFRNNHPANFWYRGIRYDHKSLTITKVRELNKIGCTFVTVVDKGSPGDS